MCSRGGGCVPQESVDCGKGSYCPTGTVCWTASAEIPEFVKKGESKCPTEEGKARLEKKIAELEREKKEAAERVAAEKKKVEEEAKRLAEQKKVDTNDGQIKDAEQLLRLEAEKKWIAELTKETQGDLRSAPNDPNGALRQIEAAARGESLPKDARSTPAQFHRLPSGRTYADELNLVYLQAVADGLDPVKAQQDWALKQLEARGSQSTPTKTLTAAKTVAVSPSPRSATVAPAASSPLRVPFDPVRLSPYRQEQRVVQQRVSGPQSIAVAPLSQTSTFPTAPLPTAPVTVAPSINRPVYSGPQTGQVDDKTALSYALLSRGAYGEEVGSGAVGYRQAGDWGSILKKAGTSSADIAQIRKSGFDASISVKGTSANGDQEVVIAFRGTDTSSDWKTDAQALSSGVVPKQYEAATKLIREAQKIFPNASIVATGHSLGGALASYAGNESGVRVVTFNAARNAYSMRGNGTNQINYSTQGDIVGDPSQESVIGTGSLPGTTRVVEGSSGQGLRNEHNIDGLIGALSDAARKQHIEP